MPDPIGNDETLDVLGDVVQVIQKKKGYRLSLDPLLLANFIVLKAKETLLDVGTGCGIIPIYLAKRGYENRLVGIEIQDDLYELCVRNRELNGCTNVEFVRGDIRAPGRALGCFHVVVSNPPYMKVRAGRACPEPSRFIARSEALLDLPTLIGVASSRLYTHGRLYLIYPVRRLCDVMSAARSGGLEPRRMRFVHSRYADPAVLALVECVKGGGANFAVEPPLYLYSDHDYTQEVKAYYA
jgi:tRNA1Val (adenine37-N6)-methyltransferase